MDDIGGSFYGSLESAFKGATEQKTVSSKNKRDATAVRYMPCVCTNAVCIPLEGPATATAIHQKCLCNERKLCQLCKSADCALGDQFLLNPSEASTTTSTAVPTTILPHQTLTETSATTAETSSTTTASTTTTVLTTTANLTEFGFQPGIDKIAAQAKAAENVLFFVSSLNESMRTSLGHERDDFLIECSFNAENCQIKKDFDEIQDPKCGNCFIFNWRFPTQFIARRTGPIYGLRLTMYSDEKDFLSIAESSGVRVVIHDQEEYPFPDSFGYNAPMGTASSFSLRKTRTKRVRKPYGFCAHRSEKRNYFYKGKYTLEGCYRTCSQQFLADQCGCNDPRIGGENLTLCLDDSSSINELCLNQFNSHSFRDNQQLCDCPLPCEETKFEVTISSSTWPLKGFAPTKKCNNGNCSTVSGANGLLVEVYFEQLSYLYTYESPAYEELNLVSDIAGQVGFWIGVSVISMVEFVIMLVKAVLYCLHSQNAACCLETIIEKEKIGKKVKAIDKWKAKIRRIRLTYRTEKFLGKSKGKVESLAAPKQKKSARLPVVKV